MLSNYNKSVLVGLLIAQVLLGLICLVHLFALGTYLVHATLSPLLFPASVLLAIGLHFLVGRRVGIPQKLVVVAAVGSLLALTASLWLASFYFDLSWDGQAYHQAAVYNLADHWNPLFQQVETPDHTSDGSIIFFPKNSWIFGAALLRLFGTVEVGKAYNFILLFAAIGVIYSLGRTLKLPGGQALLLTLLVVLNPVVWNELTGYLNDGDLYLLLVIYLASVILWIRDPRPLFTTISSLAAICLINIKFTGLIFFLITSLFALAYIVFKERNRIKSFLLISLLTGIVAVFIVGFNPYVTNVLNRGNPFYPVIGSTAFPKTSDTNEKFETPHNMKRKSLLVRLFYANFGQPGNAPYNKETDAQIAWPFTTSPQLWKAYNFQETRVGGFGPYFGVLLILTLISIPTLFISSKKIRLPTSLFLAGLVCCLSLSKHFWWPRFFPFLWLAPLAPLVLLWVITAERVHENRYWKNAARIYSWLLASFIGINGLIVSIIHMKWETNSSISLRIQLEHLREDRRPIEVDYGSFKRSMEEKLKYRGIVFTTASLKQLHEKSYKLTSVVEGYPNQVWYRFK